MELFQIRYFFHVATRGGLRSAALHLNVSMTALSKAIAKLEDEFKTQLFERRRAGLRLTAVGETFLGRAEEILALADKALREVTGGDKVPELVVAGQEIFLDHFGLAIGKVFQKRHTGVPIVFKSCSGEEALKAVRLGEAHVALVVQRPPEDWSEVELGNLRFVTACGRGHPLAEAALQGEKISVKALCAYPFISPNRPIFGRIGSSMSVDGWRDDIHPRRMSFLVESLSLYMKLLEKNEGIGYLPDFMAEQHNLLTLSVTGCKFSVRQNIFAAAKRAGDLSWLGTLLATLESR